MNVQKFIREFGWDKLKNDLHIIVKEYDCGIRVLNYDQIESPKNHPVVDECRSLVLDSDGNLVSRSFSRFYNYGECFTQDTFSFDDSVVYEKADGSLVGVYWCPQTDRWEIRTRGTAFAEANHVFGTKTNWTFREAILDAMRFTEDEFQECMSHFSQAITYVFEYTSPWNRIVTKYTEPKMVLLTGFVNVPNTEVDHVLVKLAFMALTKRGMNVRLPKVYDLKSIDDCKSALDDLLPTEEGYVIYCNKTGSRVKLKSPKYIIMHKLRGNGLLTFNNIAELVLTNEHEEYLATFEEDRQFIEPVVQTLFGLRLVMQAKYNEVCGIIDQKEFALTVKDLPYSAILFTARKLKCSTDHAFNVSTLTQQIRLLEKFI